MATKTAELLPTFVELAQAKLGVDYAGDAAALKVLRKKPANVMAGNIARLRAMADYTAPAAPVAEVMTSSELAAAEGTEKAKKAGGNGGRSARTLAFAPRVPGKVLAYAADLLRELWAADPATGEELVALLPTYTADHVSRLIDNVKATLPITEGQLRFANSLFAQKFGTEGAAEFAAATERLTKAEAKRMLDTMLTLPDYVAPAAAAAERPARRNAPEIEADGMYRNPETGDIYKVQVAHHGSGKLYAKVLVKLDEPVIKRGKEAHYEFVMARGAVMTLKPEWRLTREDAAEFGDLYGCCVRCGLVLTDEKSIARGMGEDCAAKF